MMISGSVGASNYLDARRMTHERDRAGFQTLVMAGSNNQRDKGRGLPE
jgi:hypothetical protein